MLGFFLRRLSGLIYCTLRACSSIYSDSGDFPCKAAVLTGKPGGGGQVWGALAKAENPPRTTRPAGPASRCGHRRRLTCERVSAVRHSKTRSSSVSLPFFFFFYCTSNIFAFPWLTKIVKCVTGIWLHNWNVGTKCYPALYVVFPAI